MILPEFMKIIMTSICTVTSPFILLFGIATNSVAIFSLGVLLGALAYFGWRSVG